MAAIRRSSPGRTPTPAGPQRHHIPAGLTGQHRATAARQKPQQRTSGHPTHRQILPDQPPGERQQVCRIRPFRPRRIPTISDKPKGGLVECRPAHEGRDPSSVAARLADNQPVWRGLELLGVVSWQSHPPQLRRFRVAARAHAPAAHTRWRQRLRRRRQSTRLGTTANPLWRGFAAVKCSALGSSIRLARIPPTFVAVAGQHGHMARRPCPGPKGSPQQDRSCFLWLLTGVGRRCGAVKEHVDDVGDFVFADRETPEDSADEHHADQSLCE